MENKSRSRWLDFAKGVAILIVIFGHALQGACHGNCSLGLHRFILSFQMELFFFISGIAAAYSHSDVLTKSLGKRILRLGLPYASWVWLFYLAEAVLGIKQWTLSDALGCFVFSGFWFLRYLLFILVSFELYRFGQRRWNVLAGIGLGMCVFGIVCLLPGQDGLVLYAIFFVVGFIARTVFARTGLSMSFQLPSRKLTRAIVWCGQNSLALYAVHWNVLFVFLSLQLVDFGKYSARIGAYSIVIVLFAVYLLGSIAAIWLMRKIPIVPQVFLGDKR